MIINIFNEFVDLTAQVLVTGDEWLKFSNLRLMKVYYEI